MHTSIREPQLGFVQTVALDCVVPEFGDGNAIEKCTDYCPCAVDGEDGDHDPADDTHAVCWEHSEVLHQN